MIEPVVIGDHRLYCGDCLDLLAQLPAVQAVITDPPYGIAHPCSFAARGRGHLAPCNDYADVAGDDKQFDPQPILDLDLDLPTVLWGANHFADKLPGSGGWLVWDKERPDSLDQSTCELAWTNCIKGVRRFRHLWNGMMRASEHGENYHPTQKPVALMRWVLSLPWIPEGTIFDPYMGAGPVAVACVQLQKPFVGSELSPEYFDIACRRIERELAQPDLYRDLPKTEQAKLFD